MQKIKLSSMFKEKNSTNKLSFSRVTSFLALIVACGLTIGFALFNRAAIAEFSPSIYALLSYAAATKAVNKFGEKKSDEEQIP